MRTSITLRSPGYQDLPTELLSPQGWTSKHLKFVCTHFRCRRQEISRSKDLSIFTFCALVLSASITWNGCHVSWMNSGYYLLWTRLLALFQQDDLPWRPSSCISVRRAFNQFLTTIPEIPSRYIQLKSPKLVVMVSSKGKPTDPSLREEAKEGLLCAQTMFHNVLLN